MKLQVKVVPGASREEVAGWLGDTLKIRVKAPADRGQANRAVCRLLSQTLAIPLRDIHIRAGGGSARKTIEIEGIDGERARTRLASAVDT